jgi:hypothetical protein
MKNKIMYWAIFAMLLGLQSCRETKKEKASESIEKGPKAKEITREAFDTFFQQFSEDSIFQLSRIQFPISYYSVDIEDNKEEFVFSTDDFWYIDFTVDSEAATRSVDAYEPIIEREDSKAVYVRKGIDNGIRIEYYFERNDEGKWHLTQIVDNSI